MEEVNFNGLKYSHNFIIDEERDSQGNGKRPYGYLGNCMNLQPGADEFMKEDCLSQSREFFDETH